MSRTIFDKNLYDISRFDVCPDSWSRILVSDVCVLGRGRVINEEEIASHPGPFPVYSSQTSDNGEMGRLDSYDFEGEWITWTTDGANAGTVFHRTGKFNCTNVCGTIQPKSDGEIDLRFFSYHLGRIAKNYVSYLGNPKLMNDVMGRIALILPPLPEQRKIAKILTTVDNLIEKTEALIAKYQAIKQGMMYDLFTRGVDANGRLRPTYNEAPELYKESELGWIPKEWEESTVGDVLIEKPKNGYSPSESEAWTGILMLGLGCLTPQGFSTIQLKHAPSNDPKLEAAMLHEGDILISRSNTRELVGLVGRYRNVGVPCIYPDLMMRLKPSAAIIPEFLEVILRHPPVRQQLTSAACGTSGSMVKINSSMTLKTKIPLPQHNEQQRLLHRLYPINELIRREKKFSIKLTSLKTGLMQDLLTGEVRVKVDEMEEETTNV